MTAVAGSSTARSAIEASGTAKNALASSPLKATVSHGGGSGWQNKTIRNGKGWVISCYNANSGGEGTSGWYNLDGSQKSMPVGNTNIGKFFLSSYSVRWYSSSSNTAFIPID